MSTTMKGLIRTSCAATLAVMGACSDPSAPTDPDPTDPPARELAPFVRIGGDAPYRLIGVGLDSTTYRELIGEDEAPLVTDRGPSESGERVVELHLDLGAPAMLYDALLGSSPDTSAVALRTPDLAILLGDDDDEALNALLVPAVQRATQASVEEDGTFVLEVRGAGDIVPADDALPTDAEPPVAGEVTAVIAANADGAPLGAVLERPLAAAASFSRDAEGLVSDRLRTAGPLDGWLVAGRSTSVAIDVRAPGGLVAHRFRIGPVSPSDEGGTIMFGPDPAASASIYMKLDDIEGETSDPAGEAAMFAESYATYVARPSIAAASTLQGFSDLDASGGPPSAVDVRTFWQDRASVVAQLYAAVAHASEHQALICQVGLPSMLAAAKSLAVHRAALTSSPAYAIADASEALRAVPVPVAGAHAAVLEMNATAGVVAPPIVTRACDAIDRVASFRDALAEATGTPDVAADTITRIATITPSPSALDHAMAEWIALIDGIVAGTVSDQESALAAAKTKADILIELLDENEAASAARWSLAEEIAGGDL